MIVNTAKTPKSGIYFPVPFLADNPANTKKDIQHTPIITAAKTPKPVVEDECETEVSAPIILPICIFPITSSL